MAALSSHAGDLRTLPVGEAHESEADLTRVDGDDRRQKIRNLLLRKSTDIDQRDVPVPTIDRFAFHVR